jgi:hypothetical protein
MMEAESPEWSDLCIGVKSFRLGSSRVVNIVKTISNSKYSIVRRVVGLLRNIWTLEFSRYGGIYPWWFVVKSHKVVAKDKEAGRQGNGA